MLDPHVFSVASNPRLNGLCVRCNLPQDDRVHIEQSLDWERLLHHEDYGRQRTHVEMSSPEVVRRYKEQPACDNG